MWNSINKIIKPVSLAGAWQDKMHRSSFYSGGSYLLADKPEEIEILIDLQGLLKNEIFVKEEFLHLGAAAELQLIMDWLKRELPDYPLIKAIQNSCPSINIRNQRTIGGEIGQNRPGSDVLVFLHAVQARLTVFKGDEKSISIRDWDGKGIITEISLPVKFKSINYKRYALIPSAPAIVVITGINNGKNFEFAVGGTADLIQNFQVPAANWNKETASSLARAAGANFKEDHLGSVEYKISLLETAFNRTGEVL
ncbi:MAG: FAD binding domain-containing protein [Candidatus Neomarinimicrobiota bacterium]